MKFSIRKAVAAIALAGAAAVVLPMAVSSTAGAVGPNIYGITTTNEVITLTSNLNNNAATVVERHAITGLVANDEVIGIDRRPQDGVLYIVGKDSVGGRFFLYSVNPSTGAAHPIAVMRDYFNSNAIIVPDPAATRYGIDFDPAIGVLRIISNTNENLLTVTTLTIPENFNPGDSALQPDLTTPLMQGAAYSNNVAGNTGTLYTITARKLYTTDGGTGVSTFVADLQSFSNTNSGLDITTSGSGDTAYYARGTATNSSVYNLNLTNGTTVRLLTTPTGTVLREITL